MKDPEKKRAYKQKYRQEHKKEIREYRQKWQQEHKEEQKEHKRKYREEHPVQEWTRRTLAGHKYKGFIINISTNEVRKMAKNAIYCPLCDCKLKWKRGKLCNKSPTLDRVNNEKELNKDNVWIICFQCNTTKRNRTLKEFIEYCKYVGNRW